VEVIDLRDGRPLRVLVVDDDIVVPTLLALERDDLTVDEVHRAALVPSMVLCSSPDAVVVDRWLPDGDGLDVVRWLRVFAATREVPIVVGLTGPDEVEDIDVVRAGIDACLPKPFDSDLLAATLRRLVDTPAAELRVRRAHRISAIEGARSPTLVARLAESTPLLAERHRRRRR